VEQNPLTFSSLMHRHHEADSSARWLRNQQREAIERAERAEKSAQDAWTFAKGLMRSNRLTVSVF
jgi:hypothetical protein